MDGSTVIFALGGFCVALLVLWTLFSSSIGDSKKDSGSQRPKMRGEDNSVYMPSKGNPPKRNASDPAVERAIRWVRQNDNAEYKDFGPAYAAHNIIFMSAMACYTALGEILPGKMKPLVKVVVPEVEALMFIELDHALQGKPSQSQARMELNKLLADDFDAAYMKVFRLTRREVAELQDERIFEYAKLKNRYKDGDYIVEACKSLVEILAYTFDKEEVSHYRMMPSGPMDYSPISLDAMLKHTLTGVIEDVLVEFLPDFLRELGKIR